MIIAIANQKGGQGKTTTAQAIATKATSDGKKSLAIDLDPQGNLTFSMGLNGTDAGAYELLTGQLKPEQLIHHTPQGDIIPSGINLATADTNLAGCCFSPCKKVNEVLNCNGRKLHPVFFEPVQKNFCFIPVCIGSFSGKPLYLKQISMKPCQKRLNFFFSRISFIFGQI